MNGTTVFSRSKTLNDKRSTFCPGCTHGTIINALMACLDEMDLSGESICVGCVGCGGNLPFFLNMDATYSMHGRAPANATGIKRMNPDKIVFTYQGDGDLAAIGTAEIIHAANRGEKITVIFVNNTTYGMTGGQMAPTTLLGQKSTTSPLGRAADTAGYPLRVCELLSSLEGVKFLERVAVDTPAGVRKAKKAMKRAFECQRQGLGFSLVELLSTCPTNWGMPPVNALKWLRENMVPYFPEGNFKDY